MRLVCSLRADFRGLLLVVLQDSTFINSSKRCTLDKLVLVELAMVFPMGNMCMEFTDCVSLVTSNSM